MDLAPHAIADTTVKARRARRITDAPPCGSLERHESTGPNHSRDRATPASDFIEKRMGVGGALEDQRRTSGPCGVHPVDLHGDGEAARNPL